MIATTIDSGDADKNLETAKQIEITCCSMVGKFRHNKARPISVTFSKRDDKEALHKLPSGILANKEYPIHVKRNHDRL